MPRPLSFKQRYVPLILAGTKDQTLRASTDLVRGDRVAALCRYSEPPFAWLEIRSVVSVTIGSLRTRDARRSGHASLPELRVELARLYRGRALPRVLARIRFRVVWPQKTRD